MAVSIQCLGLVDSPRAIPSREQDNLGVNERSGGDGIVQGLFQDGGDDH